MSYIPGFSEESKALEENGFGIIVVGKHAADGWTPELVQRGTVLVRQTSRDVWRNNTVFRRSSSGVGVLPAIPCVLPYHHAKEMYIS